ncbi:MAG: hypothetical protein Q4A15_05985 [Prevotellaceae bacterium]|nr:hypothetical protein [Prevotellaceae bacterium]
MMPNYPTFQPYNQPYQPQPQYQPINNGLAGRIVDDFNAVGASDVPMDGSASVFIKRDLSEIQLRKWGSDGRIYSTAYKPHTEGLNPIKTNYQDNNLDGLNERLQAIEEKIDKLIKPTAGKKVNVDANS